MTVNLFDPAALLSGEPGTILGHRIKRSLDPWVHIEIANFIRAARDLESLPPSFPSEERIREICGWFELSEQETDIVLKQTRAKQQK